MSIVENRRQAIGPATGPLQDDDRPTVRIGDGQLVQRSASAPDHDQRVASACGEDVSRSTQPGRKHDVDVRIGGRPIHGREKRDGEPTLRLGAFGRRGHHAPEPSRDDHAAGGSDETPDLIGSLHRRSIDRIVGTLLVLSNDADGQHGFSND